MATFGRMMAVGDYADEIEEAVAVAAMTTSIDANSNDVGNNSSFLRLARMVVLPEYQGRGTSHRSSDVE